MEVKRSGSQPLGKVDWMEKVTDGEYAAGESAE